jgi:poly [ADP-ribose] polymerase 2/3/4
MENFYVPGKKVVKLIFVSADNHNKFYNLFDQGDGTFKVNYGRVQGTSQTMSYPMSGWDKIYREKTRKGYKDVTHLFTESIQTGATGATGGTTKIARIANNLIHQFIEKIQAYATKSVAANYTVSQDDVTEEQVNFAQGILTKISTGLDTLSNNEIDKLLLELYSVIPRKMVHVRDHLTKQNADAAQSKKWLMELMDNEQKTLDVMAGQVELIKKEREAQKESANEPIEKELSILDVMGIQMQEVDANEIALIKQHLGPTQHQFRAAFKVVNKKSEEKFNKAVEQANNKKTQMFWHGSRNENWFNILQTGLLIRPSGAVYTGSMYSDGVYFADKAQKSIGYSSLRGSYWTRGNSNVGYLALFETHIGAQKHIYKHDSSCYSITFEKLKKDGFDSVFAHGGADLRNNEYIVYNPSQCTIRYIVELEN